MADVPEQITDPTPLKGTVSYSRKVQVRQYEAAEAYIAIQFDIDRDDDAAAIAEKAHLAMTAAKGVVWDELGIEYEVTEGNILQEVVRSHFGGGTVEATSTPGPASPSPAAQAAAAALGSAEPPHDQSKLDWKTHKTEMAENRAWAAKRFLALGDNWSSEFYDNRASKPKPTAFDYRHKATKIGIWESDLQAAREG